MSDERSIDSEFRPAIAVAEVTSNGTGEDHAEAPEASGASTTPAQASVTDEATASTEAAAMGEVTEASAETATATATEATEASAETVETAAPSAQTAEASATTPDVTAAAEPAAAAQPEEIPDFLTQLTRAMQQTVGTERARVVEDIDRRRAAQIALIQGRRDAEAARMRELADEDRRAIDTWAETEHRRIQAERERRTAELEADLRRSLEEHGRQVTTRIQAIEEAIGRHRAEVDGFFAALDGETDPVRIAQQAGQRPTFPDLDGPSGSPVPSPAAAAPAQRSTPLSTAKRPPVPVMDPIARLGLLSTSDLPEEPAADTPADAAPSVLTPVSARTSGRPEEAGAASHAQSSGLNPIGWLRRNNDQGDR